MKLVNFMLLILVNQLHHLHGQICVRDSLQLNNAGVFAPVEQAGRIEICRCDAETSCSWHTVSTGSLAAPFSWKNSIVACRQLSFPDVQSPILQNTVPSSSIAPSSVPIYQTTFICDGTESHLVNCTAEVNTNSIFTHSSDAYVNCQSVNMANKVRLTGVTAPDEGVVEIYRSSLGLWVTICSDSWTSTEANILCQSLGYLSGTATTYTGPFGPEIDIIPSVSSVTCTGVSVFSDCTILQGSNCQNSRRLAGAVCLSDSSVTEGSVQLETFTSASFDRVEVYYNGRWGTVCDVDWDMADGQVACSQLGMDYDSVPLSPQSFNSLSSRPIYVSSYNCFGNEVNLTACLATTTSVPIGFAGVGCSHSNDAGLSCASDNGGLSSSAITGIVFGVVVLLFLIPFFYVTFLKDWLKEHNPLDCLCDSCEKCVDCVTDCDCDCISCPTRQPHTIEINLEDNNRTNTSTTHVNNQQPRRSTTSSSGSSSSSDVTSSDSSNSLSSESNGLQSSPFRAATVQSSQPTTNEHENAELTKVAPPTYNDALELGHVKPPPEYVPPVETEKEADLPYPIIHDFNPAYPPPPLLEGDYQGYPPPTIHESDFTAQVPNSDTAVSQVHHDGLPYPD